MNNKFVAGALGIALGASTTLIPQDPINTIKQAQEEHYRNTGSYVQIIKYETPSNEEGFQLIYEKQGKKISEGFGPEATARTFSSNLPNATSTHENISR